MQHNIEVGDLVRYRDWRPGDQPVESVPEDKRGWGVTGIVIGIEDWRIGTGQFHPNCGILILDANSDFTLVKAQDLEIVSKAKNMQFFTKTALWSMPPMDSEAAANIV